MPDLGVIIVDEEHDGAYKQDDRFRYHARDLAIVRARDARCPIVLGSATPSIESYAHAQSGRYVSLELPDRVESRPLPSVEVIDRRGSGGPASLSPELRGALEENLAEGGQSLLFLNRRGFAHYLQCIDCGHSLECPQCSISLTFHLRDRTLRCHHCNHRRRAPDECPDCGNPTLRDVGSGTEQIERAVREALPAARVARMDRDTMARKGAFRLLLDTWRKGELDVVVGTQMVTKGHDIPGLTLVGVIAAEQSLHMPDFRAGERNLPVAHTSSGASGASRAVGPCFDPDVSSRSPNVAVRVPARLPGLRRAGDRRSARARLSAVLTPREPPVRGYRRPGGRAQGRSPRSCHARRTEERGHPDRRHPDPGARARPDRAPPGALPVAAPSQGTQLWTASTICRPTGSHERPTAQRRSPDHRGRRSLRHALIRPRRVATLAK